jgi:GWxTD domain-containing protein
VPQKRHGVSYIYSKHFPPFMRTLHLIILAAATITTAVAQRTLELRVNIGQYIGDSATAMVQIYVDVPSSNLTYLPVGASGVGTVRFRAELAQSGIRQIEEGWSMHVPKPQTGGDRSFLGVHTIFARPGAYTLTVIAYDSVAPSIRDSLVIPYTVRDFNVPRVQFSSLQLGRSFRYARSDETSQFIKGGIEILPNVTETYVDGGLLFSYYTELYNLSLVPPEASPHLDATIFDAAGNAVYHRTITVRRGVTAVAVSESLSVDALTSGRYRLYLRASVPTAGGTMDTIIARREFTVMNSALPPLADPYDAPDVASSDFSGKSELALDSLFQLFSCAADATEKALYWQLRGPDAKSAFLFAFWQGRNNGAGHYTLRSYVDAVERANLDFKTAFKPGWKTDRGRILLQYGPYSRHERHLFEVDSKPYELWYYDEIEGGVFFVFVDGSGFGDFKLVHSTARSETHDESWREHYAKGLMKGQ